MMQFRLLDSLPVTNDRAIDKTVAEYFAGIGLVRLGLELAGWTVIYANDFDPKKYEMYTAYFPDAVTHYSQEDVFELRASSVPDTILATASFPCIDLSLAGNQNGLAGKHSSAFWGFIRILREQGERRPPLVMIENVPGWLTSNQGEDFRVTIQALNDLGYACDVYSLDAVRFTPQSRLRIFVVGVKTEHPNSNIYTLFQRASSLSNKTVKDAIVSYGSLRWHFLEVPEPPRRDGELKDIVEEIPDDDPLWWSAAEVVRHLAMMAPLHRERVEVLAGGETYNYKTMYRRRRNGFMRAEVRDDNKAGCLRTARGGSSRQMLIAAGKGTVKMRHMMPREYARLQGVPDDYPLPNNTIQALTGFGDAVCVPVIAWVAANILNPLAEAMTPVGHAQS